MKKDSPNTKYLKIPEGVEKQRLAKAYLIVSFIKGIKQAIIPVAVIIIGYIFNFENDKGALISYGNFTFNTAYLVWIMIVAVLVIMIASVLIQYFNTFWYLTDSDVVLSKGLINKKTTRMPYEKIHSINTNESLVERMFNVVSVKIDSAGGAASGDIIIPSIKNETAENLRNEIRQRMQFQYPEANTDTPENSASSNTTSGFHNEQQTSASSQNEKTNSKNASISNSNMTRGYSVTDVRAYTLSIKEILIAGLANGRAILYLVIGIGAVWQIIENTGLSEYVYDHGSELANTFVSYGIPLIIFAIICLILISWIVSVISFAIKYFGFSIRTEGDRIEIQRGLLSRVNSQISINRIQEIHITQDILARVFGYATIKAHVASSIGSNENNENLGIAGIVVHPFIKRSEVDGYIAAFLPEYIDRPKELEALPKASCRRSFFRYARWTIIFWILPILTTIFILSSIHTELSPYMSKISTIAIVICLIGIVFQMFTAWRSYKGRGIAIEGKIIALKNGAYKTTTVFVPKRKIQLAQISQNPFQRMSKVSNIYIHTAAKDTASHIRDASENYAFQYLSWAIPNATKRASSINKDLFVNVSSSSTTQKNDSGKDGGNDGGKDILK